MGEQPIMLNEEFFQDAHRNFAECRARAAAVPAAQGLLTGWLVTRYRDVRALLTDPRVSKDYAGACALYPREALARISTPIADHMLHADPPRHTRLRKLAGKAFSPRAIGQLEPAIEKITDQLLADMAGAETVDFMESFAYPLPITVICEVLGIPSDDRQQFQEWTRIILSSARSQVIAAASRNINDYLEQLISRKRADPRGDILSSLVQASDDGDSLTHAELVGMTALLLGAGFDTTAHALGNSVLALLRHPEQLDVLRADPSRWPAAIEELLRFDGVINLGTMRFTTDAVRLGDTEIPAGQFIFLALLSANRDDDRFPHAGELDLDRPDGSHLGFGHGVHHCLGAPLARLELTVALRSLFDRFPHLALADGPTEPEWRHSWIVHGFDSFRLRLH